MTALKGKTLFISGASRGIGLAIALRARGHEVIEPLGQTSANSIAVTPNGLLGAPDPRTRGAEAAGQ